MKDFGIDRLTTHPEENFNGFIRDGPHAQDTASTMMRIIAHSSLAKNFMIKHKVETYKCGRANIGVLKISDYYGAIDELSDDFTPKQLVNAVFVIAGVVHDKAMINPEQCDIGAFMNFALWLDSALPWSKTRKYQRIKQYKVNELS
jgi:hypothetical protein